MSRPMFLVDGKTEQFILSKICNDAKLRVIDCNGNGVSITAIAEKIRTLIRLDKFRSAPYIIVIDKEDRSDDIKKIRKELCSKITYGKDFTNIDVRIGIADRMFENWLIAGVDELFQKLKIGEKDIEGCNAIKKIKNIDRNYNKIANGYLYFQKIDLNLACQRSRSFRSFFNEIKDLQCDFLSRNNGNI